jgi:hypothetical protein
LEKWQQNLAISGRSDQDRKRMRAGNSLEVGDDVRGLAIGEKKEKKRK